MILDSAKNYLATATHVKIAHLVAIELPGTDGTYAYLTDYQSTIIYDGDPYQSGRVTKVSTIRMAQGVQNYTLQVYVAGEFSSELNRAISDDSYEGRELKVYKAYLDNTGNIIPFDPITNGPELLFTGKITSINISEDYSKGSSTITWECAGLLHDFEKINGRLSDDASHRGLAADGVSNLPIPTSGAKKEAYKTDTGFQHANQTISSNISYLGKEKQYYLKKSWGGLKSKLREREVIVQRELDLKVSLEARYLPVVYGVRRIPGIPVFLDSLRSDPSTMYCVYAFCEGEIEAFLNLYVDGVPAICTNGDAAASTGVCMGNAQNGDTLSVYLDEARRTERSNNWERYPYDRDGSNVDRNEQDSNPAPSTTGTLDRCKINILAEKGALECQFFHGKPNQLPCEDLVSIASADNFLLQGQLRKSDGSVWGADYWEAAGEGKSGSALLDTAYIVVKFKITEDRTEIPNLEAVVSGKLPPVRSAPGTVSYQYTLNPVWHLLDYLSNDAYGGGLDIDTQIDLESFHAVAQQLNVDDTSYQTNFIKWWRYIGWKPGAYSRAIMQCNTLIQTENAVTKNVEELLSQFNGTLNVVGGKYRLSMENNGTPVASISMGDVIGRVTVQNIANKDKWNSIQASIIDPAMDWSTNQISFFNSVYLTEDNLIRKKGQAAFSQITNYYTARALAERTLNQSRAGRLLKMTVHYKYQYLLPNDVVTFTYPRFGYNATKFRVKEVEIQPEGLVGLTLDKFNPDGYTNTHQPEISAPIGSGGIPSPTNLELELLPKPYINIDITDPDVYAILMWDASEIENIMYYSGYYYLGDSTNDRIPFKVEPGVEVGIGQPVPTHYKPYVLIKNMVANTKYTFKVQVVTTSGQKSPYEVLVYNNPEQAEPALIPDVKNFRVTNLGTDGTFIGPNISLSWEPLTQAFVNSYEIRFKDANTNTMVREVKGISRPSSTYTFTLAENMDSYAVLNSGAVGAYREFIITIVTRSASGKYSEGVTL